MTANSLSGSRFGGSSAMCHQAAHLVLTGKSNGKKDNYDNVFDLKYAKVLLKSKAR